MSFSDPLCKSPVECDHTHVALAEIRIASCSLQSGLEEQTNKANRRQFGYHGCKVTASTKMVDGCWVHRGEEEDRDDVETPGCPPLLSESRKGEEITGHHRWDYQHWVQLQVRRGSHNAPYFHQHQPDHKQKLLFRCNRISCLLSVLLWWRCKVPKIFLIPALLLCKT